VLFFYILVIFVILVSFSCHIFKIYLISKSFFFQVLQNFLFIYSSFLNYYIMNEVLMDSVDNFNQNGCTAMP
jgi:hypothetical protein